MVDNTPVQDNQGPLVPLLEAAAVPKLAFTEHNSHHLLLRGDGQSLQALWVQTPLHLAGEQAENGAVAESSCREPILPPSSQEGELKQHIWVKRERAHC